MGWFLVYGSFLQEFFHSFPKCKEFLLMYFQPHPINSINPQKPLISVSSYQCFLHWYLSLFSAIPSRHLFLDYSFFLLHFLLLFFFNFRRNSLNNQCHSECKSVHFSAVLTSICLSKSFVHHYEKNSVAETFY